MTPRRLGRRRADVHFRAMSCRCQRSSGVGRDDRGDVAQDATAQPVGQRGQPSSVGVGQPKAPSSQLPVQQAILFNEVGDRISLTTVQPAGDDHQQQPKCRDVDHGRESISQARGPA